MATMPRADGASRVPEQLERKPQPGDWRAQRVGWAVMVLVVLAGLAGLAGPGPLGVRRLASPDGALGVEYPRFWRAEKPLALRLSLGPGAAPDGEARVWVSRAYLERMRLEGAVPPPHASESGPDRVTFRFRVAPGAGGAGVVLRLVPEGAGVTSGRVGVEGGPALDLWHLVYP
jgi:hypothetical protein